MTFYYPDNFFESKARWHIFPLLKALLKEEGHQYEDFQISDTFNHADCVILPMSWNYYYRIDCIDQILNYCSNLPRDVLVISFVFGDFGVKVPNAYKGLVFRTSGYRSKLPENHIGMPVFIDDPVAKYVTKEVDLIRSKNELATVGFCGQARSFGWSSFFDMSKIVYRNLKRLLGLSVLDKQQLVSATYLRWQLLDVVKKSNKVISNLIIRNTYRAGVHTNKAYHNTTLAFYDNLRTSDFVLCVRGAGNFSTRFYETLAMGRIPIFVNTDCLLPLHDTIDWKQHVVWIEVSDKKQIPQAVKAFYDDLDETSLNQQILKNRNLWIEHLQVFSFFKTFFNAY